MSNLVKVQAVSIYYGVTDAQAMTNIFACKEILDSLGIPYANLVYTETSQVEELFANLGTWTYGADYEVHEFNNFPLITWQEFYDDHTNFNNVATSVEELNTKLVPLASRILLASSVQ